jgi:ligand-binding sensor domain-containing protein
VGWRGSRDPYPDLRPRDGAALIGQQYLLRCVALGKDGSLWAGTEGGGLLRLRGNRLRVYSTNDGLTEGFVRSVYEDDRGRLWVGTDDGLFVLEGERLRRVDQSATGYATSPNPGFWRHRSPLRQRRGERTAFHPFDVSSAV